MERKRSALRKFVRRLPVIRPALFAILTLCSVCALATTLMPPPLEWVAANSDIVVRVQVTAAQAYMFEHNGRSQICAIEYEAAVQEIVKGKVQNDTLAFVSNMRLAAGTEYLLFLNPWTHDRMRGGERKMRYQESSDIADRNKCLVKLKSNWQATFSFRFFNATWLEKEITSPLLPEGVETTKLKCGSDVIGGCGSVGEPLLIEWRSLKKLLTEVPDTREGLIHSCRQ